MTEKLRKLFEDVQAVYEGKGMVVHPNSFDKLRMEVIKLDNINRLQGEQIENMKNYLSKHKDCKSCKNNQFILAHQQYECVSSPVCKWELKEK